MPDLCPKGIDLGVKPSAPSFTSPVSVRPQTTLISVETQTIEVREAQTAVRRVQRKRVSWAVRQEKGNLLEGKERVTGR